MLRGFFILVLLSFISAGLADAATNPLKNLTEVASFTTTDPHSAEFFKDYLFIADGNSLLVYNASNPERPKYISTFTNIDYPGKAYGISISENQLYVATGPGWIYVLNITDPEKPKKLYQIASPNVANDVAVNGKYMYVADANTGMLIYDLSDRTNPELIGTFYVLRSNVSGYLTGWGGISVAVSGNYAFLSGAERQGFYIIDVSDPANPKEVFHSTGRVIYDMAVSGNDVYLAHADGTSVFELLDVSNPYEPNITGTFSITDTADRSAIAIHPSGDYVYAASGNTWHIFRKPETTPPQITIERPKNSEVLADQVITVSGRAFDKSGIMEVLVNGKFAGTEVWSQTVILVEGINNITITASDKKGNSRTETIHVTYSPSLPLHTSTPVQPLNATPAAVRAGGGINVKNLAVYGIGFLVLIILIYWLWMHKIKK